MLARRNSFLIQTLFLRKFVIVENRLTDGNVPARVTEFSNEKKTNGKL